MGLGGVDWSEKLEIKPTQPQFELKLGLSLAIVRSVVGKQICSHFGSSPDLKSARIDSVSPVWYYFEIVDSSNITPKLLRGYILLASLPTAMVLECTPPYNIVKRLLVQFSPPAASQHWWCSPLSKYEGKKCQDLGQQSTCTFS